MKRKFRLPDRRKSIVKILIHNLHFKVFDAKLLSKSEIALRILILLLFAKTFLLASIHYFRCQKLITIVALRAWVYQANVGCGICIWLSSTLPCTILDQIYVLLERNENILFYACFLYKYLKLVKPTRYRRARIEFIKAIW